MSSIAVTASASGTGVVSLQAPITSTNRTITLPDSTGTILTTATPGVPIGGPAFFASPAANTQVPSINVFTKVTLGNELFDTNNNFDAANSRFQPSVAGYYQVSGTVHMNNTVSRMITSLWKNGAEYSRGFDVIGNINAGSAAALIFLNGSTDFVELYTLNGSGGQALFVGTQLSASLVRSAT